MNTTPINQFSVCMECGEEKNINCFKDSSNLCTLCVAQAKQDVNIAAVELRRRCEERRELAECDYSLDAIKL